MTSTFKQISKKRHFHTFDALRFFAFLKVYLLHVPLQGKFPLFAFLKFGGGIGVSFFFVLSGFLITYILSFEKLQKGKINVKKFLIRRSFRIWPLFFLMVLLAAFLPYDFKQSIGFHMVGGGYDFDWRYSFTFLENYKMLIEDTFPKTTPLPVFWSLCIEEHFYLLWVFVFFILPVKKLPYFLLLSIPLAWLARFVEPSIWHNGTIDTNDLFTNIDYFAIGGLLGYFVAKEYKRVAQFIKKQSNAKWFGALAVIILLVLFQKWVFPNTDALYFNIIRSTLIALTFTSLIALFIPQDSKKRIGEKSILTYLGKISYGLYVYHIIWIHMVFQYYLNNNILIDDTPTLLLFVLITFVGSVITSIVSWHLFEKPILKLRERF